MHIQIFVNGELRKAWEIPPFYLEPIDGATWQQNVDARQLIVDRYLEQFQNFVAPLFSGHPGVEFCLTFESKMNVEQQLIDVKSE
jgi:hypothetical protein